MSNWTKEPLKIEWTVQAYSKLVGRKPVQSRRYSLMIPKKEEPYMDKADRLYELNNNK